MRNYMEREYCQGITVKAKKNIKDIGIKIVALENY